MNSGLLIDIPNKVLFVIEHGIANVSNSPEG